VARIPETKDVNSSLGTLQQDFSSSSACSVIFSLYRAAAAAAAAAAGERWSGGRQMKGGLCRLIVAPNEPWRGRLHSRQLVSILNKLLV